MKINKWGKKQGFDKGGIMVRVDDIEAIRIIQSLTHQLLADDGNSGRAEFYTEDGEYFSISVSCRNERTVKECIDIVMEMSREVSCKPGEKLFADETISEEEVRTAMNQSALLNKVATRIEEELLV